MEDSNLEQFSIEMLKDHLKNKHDLSVDVNQEKDLRNIGYYHGYKGYRFIRKSNNPVKITSFSQLVSLNNYDMQLKGIFYPNLMFIENALKSYVIEATLANSHTENLNDIYRISLTYYKENFQEGSNNYKKEFKKKKDLEMKITSSLTRDYMQGKGYVNHFYDHDRDIPIWAAFESLSLGEFGTFFSCANKEIRNHVSELIDLPKNLDDDGFLLADIINTLRDLRNAIAHNGIIFDTRFSSNKVPSRIKQLLIQELKIKDIDFNYMVAYVVLIVFMLYKIKETRRCKSFVQEFIKLQGMLEKLEPECKMQIKGTDFSNLIYSMGKLLDTEFKC